MSARDDQPATVPPPAGEDDAYSATTKVGAMPADIMEKLRAEGLLPEDVAKDEGRATAVPIPRPSTSLERRPTPPPPSPPVNEAPVKEGEPVPQLYSIVPPPEHGHPTTKPPAPFDSAETPVAFTKPSSAPPPKLPRDDDGEVEPEEDSSVTREETTGLTRHKAAALASEPPPNMRPLPSRMTMLVVGAVVVLLLIVALVRLSR